MYGVRQKCTGKDMQTADDRNMYYLLTKSEKDRLGLADAFILYPQTNTVNVLWGSIAEDVRQSRALADGGR